MKTSDLLVVGIRGSVVALNRVTGEQVWATHLKRAGFVNVTVQGGTVVASCEGEIFCLNLLTGEGLWHNPLKGFGTGLGTIAADCAPGANAAPVLAEKHRRDEEAAAAASAASV